ncbi:nudix hydrolase 9 isoform X2 [Phragmites australis]|uniref:nudix hydrolase 9 isoform X2 n=1 Tax=Phragmites australis TaxID=29695 RepID=UPI002D76D10B|nr:nudix hydrolase 9 isoform X2 [Phragmites australis]
MAAPAPTSAAAADPGTAYKLLLSCPAGLPRSRVSVKFDQSFDRIPHPDATLEESISEIWNQRHQRNPSLYNGTKFRYGGNALHHKDGPNQEYCVSLHLGLTDYRTFVGTNLNPLWEKFLVPSEDDSVYCQHMSNPLGNGAIVETSDEKIIVLQRSYNVGEFPGYYVFPGGHSEPQEIGIMGHQTDEEDLARLSERVSQEMFEGIIREVVEETGVPASSLTDPVFIGVSRREMNVRPTAFFFTKCNIDSSGVSELYSRAQDGYESTKLYAVSVDELRGMSQRMPGCHNGGFALYELMRNAAESFEHIDA